MVVVNCVLDDVDRHLLCPLRVLNSLLCRNLPSFVGNLRDGLSTSKKPRRLTNFFNESANPASDGGTTQCSRANGA